MYCTVLYQVPGTCTGTRINTRALYPNLVFSIPFLGGMEAIWVENTTFCPKKAQFDGDLIRDLEFYTLVLFGPMPNHQENDELKGRMMSTNKYSTYLYESCSYVRHPARSPGKSVKFNNFSSKGETSDTGVRLQRRFPSHRKSATGAREEGVSVQRARQSLTRRPGA